jgi:hypothetical protein
MTVSVRVHSLKQSASDKVTAIVVVQPSQFASFRIDVTVDDAGSQDRNLQQVAGALLRFSQQFSEALKQPLRIEPTPAPER